LCGKKAATPANVRSGLDIAFYRFHHAGPGSDTELSRLSQRQIGNHLKNPRSKFRIVNYSFTPRVEMLACNKNRKVVPTNVRRCL
jgi:hypothetical protein